ncbi:MAG: nucleotidyltransferase family protein [Actinomycetota bacterium]|nr:nucleotidyltransferase family protein [Actinomycetota bacterium]
MATDQWEKGDVDQATVLQVLEDTTQALEGAGIPYLFIGGLPLAIYGRPKPIQDLDLMVKHEDAARAIEALEAAGFDSKDPSEHWLHKAAKEGVLVDVITRSEGDLFIDDEMLERSMRKEYKGHQVRLISPEDLLVMKAVAHEEDTAHYWHDAMTLIVGADLNWDYVVRRARHGAKRVLSLLIYAQSRDLFVPDDAIAELYRSIYG